MMKTKKLLFGILLLLLVHETVYGQALEDAKDAFKKEDYWQAIKFCTADKREFSRSLILENIYTYSTKCDSLSKRGCDIPSLKEVKDIRTSCEYRLTVHPKTDKKLADCESLNQSTVYSIENNPSSNSNAGKNITANTNLVLAELKRAYDSGKKPDINIANATQSAITNLQAIWERSPFYVTEKTLGKVEKKENSGWEIKNIPVSFKKGGDCEIIIEYNEQGVINNITRVLQKKLFETEQIMEENSYPLDDPVQFKVIYDFLNQFSAAFWDKNLKFIEMVFDDYALIIHEETTKVAHKIDENGERIKYRYTSKTEKDKTQYIDDLREAFKNNEWINVDFYDIKIYRSNKNTNFYGINIKQLWQSPNKFYESDCGWVFLEIDFNNPEEPSIWIKTWQPYETPENERYWLGSFVR